MKQAKIGRPVDNTYVHPYDIVYETNLRLASSPRNGRQGLGRPTRKLNPNWKTPEQLEINRKSILAQYI